MEERFWKKVNKTPTCWLWTASRYRNGYGQFGVRKGVNRGAHRVAYELVVGPIPEGMHLDHICRVRHCVNPKHLEPVTHRENVRRGLSGGKTHCKRGHKFTEENTEWRKNGTRACRACAHERYLKRKAKKQGVVVGKDH